MSRAHCISAFFLLSACNALSGADGLTVDPKSDQVDNAPIVVDGGYKNNGSSSGGHGGTTLVDAGTQTPIEASTTDTTGLPTFFDDFARPNGTLGNGWVMKASGKFTIDTESVKQTGTGVFANLVNRRPTSEDGLNFESSIVVSVANDHGDPSIHARIQPGSDANDVFQSYTFYPGGLDTIFLEREDIDHTTPLASVAMNPKMAIGTAYRVTLKVTGASPVHLEGKVETTAGATLGTIVFDDNDAKRIQTAGSIGFGSGDANGARFDDFKRVTLP